MKYNKILTFALFLLFGILFFANHTVAETFYQNGRYGLKDYRGRIVLPARFEYIYKIPLEDRYIVHDRNSYFLVNEDGKFFSSRYTHMKRFGSDDYLKVKETYMGDYGLIDLYGHQILPCIYQDLTELNRDLLIARYRGLEGIIDYNNNIIIPFKYDNIELYGNGLLKVRVNGRYGLINYSDQLILEIAYEDLYNLDDDILAIQLNGAWGAMMLDHRQIVPVQYKKVSQFKDIYIRTNTVNGYQGLFTKQGKQILQDKYNKIELKEGYFIVKEGKLFGLVNPDGVGLTQSKYSKIKYNKNTRSFEGKINSDWYKIDTTPMSVDDITQNYISKISQRINAYYKSPYSNSTQKTVVSFQVLRDGQIRNPQIVQSSGIAIFDSQALNAIKQLGKVEPIPPELVSAGKTFLTINYKL